MQSLIPHSKPSITEHDVTAVNLAVRSGQLAAGWHTRTLESSLASRLNRRAVCVSSGTAALHMALLTAGIQPGDAVALPTHSCPSVLYALHYVGAVPVLYDSGRMGIGTSLQSLNACRNAKHIKAIITVHQYGIPDPVVSELSGVPLIEDCAASLGATVHGRLVGSFGHASVFSFYGTKLVAGGECGAVATDDKSAEWIQNHRTPRGADSADTHYPYSPAETCAALANSQLDRLDGFIRRRRQLAEIYRTELADCAWVPGPDTRCEPVWHRFVIGLEMQREKMMDAARADGIQFGFGVKTPLHRLLKLPPEHYPESEHAWRHSVSLPIYPDLTESEQERIIQCVRRCVTG